MVVTPPSPVSETTRKNGPSSRSGAWAYPVDASSFWKSARPPNTRLPRRNTAKVGTTQPNSAPMTPRTTTKRLNDSAAMSTPAHSRVEKRATTTKALATAEPSK